MPFSPGRPLRAAASHSSKQRSTHSRSRWLRCAVGRRASPCRGSAPGRRRCPIKDLGVEAGEVDVRERDGVAGDRVEPGLPVRAARAAWRRGCGGCRRPARTASDRAGRPPAHQRPWLSRVIGPALTSMTRKPRSGWAMTRSASPSRSTPWSRTSQATFGSSVYSGGSAARRRSWTWRSARVAEALVRLAARQSAGRHQ